MAPSRDAPTLSHLVGRKLQDELVVHVGAEDALSGSDGEGSVPVRVALDAVSTVGFSRHEGLQVGLHDLPVEGQFHVPMGTALTVSRTAKAMLRCIVQEGPGRKLPGTCPSTMVVLTGWPGTNG